MKDVAVKCSLQAIAWAIILMVANLMFGILSWLPLQTPIRLPSDWGLVLFAFVKYWFVSFLILFVNEALRHK